MAVRRSERGDVKRAIERSLAESTRSPLPPATEEEGQSPPAKQAGKSSVSKQTPMAAKPAKSLILELKTSKPIDSTDESELSDIDEALIPPTPPEFRRPKEFITQLSDSLEDQEQVISLNEPVADTPVDPATTLDTTPDGIESPPDSVPMIVNGSSSMICTLFASAPAPCQLPSPPASTSQGADGQRRSGRAIKQPTLFGDLVETGTAVPGDEHFTLDEPVQAEIDDSPTASKQARKTSVARKARTSAPAPLSGRRLQAAKRKASTSNQQSLPTTKKPRLSVKTAPVTDSQSEVRAATLAAPEKTPARRTPREESIKKTPVRRKQSPPTLPSPSNSQQSYENEDLSHVNAELLALSRRLTARLPIESKALPRGQPSVWAPGRSELCETVPYFKSYKGGCYMNNGTVYAFMFDNTGVAREYMDEDVIIARMGGKMGKEDSRSKVDTQIEDLDINGAQARGVMNNIVHENPLVIICGDRNAGSPTKMPARYCILDWFKPTHIWAEKSVGKGGKPTTTVRYRFERLDRSKPSWYGPAGSAPDKPSDLPLEIYECSSCHTSSPQVYLKGWACLKPDCDDFWKSPTDGSDFPLGALDYNPAFLLQTVRWQKEVPPFHVNPGLPQLGNYSGDHLLYANTRGVVCPECGRCNSRYLFLGWRCDTPGCSWKLTPQPQVMMPRNLHHTPWDATGEGPSLTKAVLKPVVRTEVRYTHNYKVVKYTIEGVDGSLIVAKANQTVVCEPDGPDDMFRELQTRDFGAQRFMIQKAPASGNKRPNGKASQSQLTNVDGDDDDDSDDEHDGEVGTRMIAFGINYGQPYKFIAGGDSRSFEEAPQAVRLARTRMNWAQRVFASSEGYQEFNEELVFAYLQSQRINYHDDGEAGLGPRIATLSLGGAATMSLRVKAKYFSQVSKSGVFTDEKPLPLPVLQSSGYVSGRSSANAKAKDTNDTYEARLGAWNELQLAKAMGAKNYKMRARELAKVLDLKKTNATPLLSFHLTHGDIVIMEGEDIQKYLEHEVEPHSNLRYALTCRTVLPHHLRPDQMPKYEVLPDNGSYDGSAIREPGDKDAIQW